MTDTGRPVPLCVILAFGTMEIDAAVQRAAVVAAAGRCLVVAGLVFIPHRPGRRRQQWQVRLSHWGRPPVVLSMHRLRRDAEAQMERVQLLRRTRDLRDDDTFAALIQVLAVFGDGEAG